MWIGFFYQAPSSVRLQEHCGYMLDTSKRREILPVSPGSSNRLTFRVDTQVRIC